MEEFDIIIVGAGPGGYVAAIKAAQAGFKTAIVEREYYGGVCLNVGCIPTKTLLRSAKIVSHINHAANYGIELKGPAPIIHWDKMLERKLQVVKTLTTGVKGLMSKNKVKMLNGNSKAISANVIEVDGTKYGTKNLIIATGSSPRKLNLEGFEKAEKAGVVIDSTGALNLPKIPKTMAVIGGGVIGVEFASLYNKLGTNVTILQSRDSILELLDKDVQKEMTKIFSKNGINIETNVEIVKMSNNNTLVYKKDGKEISLKVDNVLVSIGRVPNTIGYDGIGLKLHERSGSIITDEQMKTNVAGVYAIGDVTASKMLAHVASAQATVAINTIKGNLDKVNNDRIPSCIYTVPEVASVGLTEEEVKQRGLNYKAFKFSFEHNGKALADGETDGFVKIIADPKYGEILGAHIVNSRATDMISEITALMEAEGTVYELAKAIHPHPTLSEVYLEVGLGLVDKPIHQ